MSRWPIKLMKIDTLQKCGALLLVSMLWRTSKLGQAAHPKMIPLYVRVASHAMYDVLYCGDCCLHGTVPSCQEVQ